MLWIYPMYLTNSSCKWKIQCTHINVEGLVFEGEVHSLAYVCFRITIIFDAAAVYSQLELVSWSVEASKNKA